MEFFRIQRDIPFMRHALTFNVISAVTFLIAVILLATRGLNLGIDFRGGTVIEVEYGHPADLSKVRELVERNIVGEVAVQSFGDARTALIRLPLKNDYADSPINGCLKDKASKKRAEGAAASTVSSADLSDCLMSALRADDPTATQK